MSFNTENYYWVKTKQLLSKVFPSATEIPVAGRSVALGAGLAIGITALFTSFLALVLLVSDKITDLSTLLRSGIYLSLGSFGAILDSSNLGFSQTAQSFSQVGVGVHSGFICLVLLIFAYQVSKRANRTRHGLKEHGEVSPLHLALGVSVASAAISLMSQGSSSILGLASFEVKPLSLFSCLVIFALSFAASYVGKLNAAKEISETNGIWLWVVRAIKYFVIIFSSLLVLAFIVFAIRNIIEPDFAIASAPEEIRNTLTADQSLWLAVGILLFGLNLLVQFFFLAMGVNVGLDGQGASFIYNLVDPTLLTNTSGWTYEMLGPWAYVAVLILVSIVALISGAAASDSIAFKVKGVLRFQQAYLGAVFVSASAWLITGLQATISWTSEDAEQSANMVWGASLISLVAFTTALTFFAWSGGGKLFRFVASGFPRVVQWRRNTGLLETRSYDGKVFGIFVKSLIVIACLIPLAASTINRVSSYTDGPIQVGESIAKTLTSGSIDEIKKLLSSGNDKKTKWLADSILKAAQPNDGYTAEIVVTNGLGEGWQPGNLDAFVEIKLKKDGESDVITKYSTTSTLESNGLLNHADYTAVTKPTVLELITNPFLKEDKKFSFTLNGAKSKVGKYFAIPGTYTVKADGYKLIAPTDLTVTTTKPKDAIRIGYGVSLPAGSEETLSKATKTEADKCLKISGSGEAICFDVEDALDGASIESGEAPKKYLEYVDSSFKTNKIECAKSAGKYQLLAADKVRASTDCTTEILFTRTYFDSKPKRVPKYETSQECLGQRVSNLGDPVRGPYWDPWFEENYYVDGRGFSWWDYETAYDPCWTTREVRTQVGFETIRVRGSKIGSTPMTNSVTRSIKVEASLNKDNKLVIDN